MSEDQSSRVNTAYRTLRDPLRRAQYMLELRGAKYGENFEGTISDPELLMEVMSAREEVESADPEALERLLETNDSKISATTASISRAFAQGDVDAAAEQTLRLTYYVSIRDEIVRRL
eukprot:jgi/Chlat1/673/Chrsp104S01148